MARCFFRWGGLCSRTTPAPVAHVTGCLTPLGSGCQITASLSHPLTGWLLSRRFVRLFIAAGPAAICPIPGKQMAAYPFLLLAAKFLILDIVVMGRALLSRLAAPLLFENKTPGPERSRPPWSGRQNRGMRGGFWRPGQDRPDLYVRKGLPALHWG